MNFKPVAAQIGDVIEINKNMSMKYGPMGMGLRPVWHEIPPEKGSISPEEGHFIEVTEDIWFVFENGQWRIMSQPEHVSASREVYLNKPVRDDSFFNPY